MKRKQSSSDSKTMKKKSGGSKGALFGILIFLVSGLGMIGFGVKGAVHLVGLPSTPKVSQLVSQSIDTSTNDLTLAVAHYKEQTLLKGSTTTTVTLGGDVLATIFSPKGDQEIISRSATLPHFIKLNGISYRQINPDPNSMTSALDTPSNEVWTTDLSSVTAQIDEYTHVTNPASIISDLLPYVTFASVHNNADGTRIVAMKGALSSIPVSIANRYGFLTPDTNMMGSTDSTASPSASPAIAGDTVKTPVATPSPSASSSTLPPTPSNSVPTVLASGDVWMYVTLSEPDSIKKIMVVLPDTRDIMVSVDGPALKSITKPDLTRVAPDLKLVKKTP
jgi:hypothetical protein